jgi:gliding motility-associated-like protein
MIFTKSLQADRNRAAFFLLALALFVVASPSRGQDLERPVAPLFTGVTVNSSTGSVEMKWDLSPSTDVAGYVVYQYDTIKREGYYIDSLYNPAASSYSAFRPKTAFESESYVIAAFDNSGNISPLSNRLNTIFCKVVLDTCNKKINLSWNKYLSYPYKVSGYDVLVSENNGSFEPKGHIVDGSRQFAVDTFNIGSTYCYLVKATMENSQVSLSSKSCLTAAMQKPPGWINADFATVTADGEIALSFTVDPSAETDLYTLERKSGMTGSYEVITTIRAGVGTIAYTDKDADPEAVNFYRLNALNSCETSVAGSNVASNMVLTYQVVNDQIVLRWNGYRDWLGSVSGYRLLMDTGDGFNQYADIPASDTSFMISIPDIIHLVATGDVCFRVTASEENNPHGIAGESSSEISCYEISETITVPNLFTPDGDLRNDLFCPVITFTPVDYHLVVSDRQGRVVFNTTNYSEAWDGTANGELLPQGPYIWSLRVRTLTKKNIFRTGTVTIYRNK